MLSFYDINTFDEELHVLLELIRYKRYLRYGENLCLFSNDQLCVEYNICEFVWGYCKNPCFAKRLITTLEKTLTDNKVFYKSILQSNTHVTGNKVFPQWELALTAAEDEQTRPMIVYSTETSSMISSKTIFCNEVDGEFWHGILLPPEIMNNIDTIEIKFVDDSKTLGKYEWNNRQIRKQCIQFKQAESLLYFSPFKHPIVFSHSILELHVTFNFIDHRLPNESNIKMVYGVCNKVLENWLEKYSSLIVSELINNDKLVTYKGKHYIK